MDSVKWLPGPIWSIQCQKEKDVKQLGYVLNDEQKVFSTFDFVELKLAWMTWEKQNIVSTCSRDFDKWDTTYCSYTTKTSLYMYINMYMARNKMCALSTWKNGMAAPYDVIKNPKWCPNLRRAVCAGIVIEMQSCVGKRPFASAVDAGAFTVWHRINNNNTEIYLLAESSRSLLPSLAPTLSLVALIFQCFSRVPYEDSKCML